jgi:ABC-type polysaccharide/polyol phosphate transport system ATPase subunit
MSKITVNGLSLKFRIYHDNAPSLKAAFAGLLKGRPKRRHTEFWALKDVSLEVNAGDRLGIIGHNGAGKSTLLKVLCKIYEPQVGLVRIDGKIAPLLEIGAGFHPEFTGRENIYLNGTILGYTKKQLAQIEEEVIDFAEVKEFIDTPVKYFSTGMYMRLAFSLATAVEPDILILDEVFAGGDAGFVLKARERMHSMVNRANIMIMVSHDLGLIESLCNRVLWLDHGRMVEIGEASEVIKSYLSPKS